MSILDQKDRIIRAKVTLNRSRPFFSYILLNMNIEQTESKKEIPTMGVNQYGDLWWNEDFVKEQSDAFLESILCHEAMHVSMLTFQRKGSRDLMLWNMATDLIINALLMAEGFTFPKDCLLPDSKGSYTFTGVKGKVTIPDVINKTAEEIYDIFESNAEKIRITFGKGNGQDNGQYKGQLDSHIEGDNNDKGESTGKGKTESDQKANENVWKAKVTEAATNAKMRGTLSANIERILDGVLNPEIDWRARLHQFITKEIPVDYTMKLPGRRFYSSGIYYPSIIRENLDIITGVDVSGSIGGEEYGKFMSELLGIANAFPQINMRVIFWGTEVQDGDDIVVSEDARYTLMKHKPRGGGGTELSSFERYVNKRGYNSRLYIILTDGYIENKPKLPNGHILFVLPKNCSTDIVKHHGEVCRLQR